MAALEKGGDVAPRSWNEGEARTVGNSRPTPGWPELVAAGAGLLSGTLAAVAYYSVFLNPLTHAFTIWVVLAVVVVRRQPSAQAIMRATIALLGAVVAFYVGKKVVYGIKYAGSSYELNVVVLIFWCIVAIGAGIVFGLVFRHIGNDDQAGKIATAAAIGLLIGDAVRRYGLSDPLLLVAVSAGVALVMWLGARSGGAAIRIALWSVPLAVVGFAVSSAPDLLQQLRVVGF